MHEASCNMHRCHACAGDDVVHHRWGFGCMCAGVSVACARAAKCPPFVSCINDDAYYFLAFPSPPAGSPAHVHTCTHAKENIAAAAHTAASAWA